MSWLMGAGQSMLPQSVGTAATAVGNNSWLDAFGNFGSKLFDGNNLANIGGLMGGAGSLYGAYNANKIGNAQIDLTKQQNQLMLDKYSEDNKRRDSLDNSFASVWGK